MKLNQLLLLGATASLASVLSVSSSAVLANSSSARAVSPAVTSTRSHAVVAQNQTTALKSGTFVAAEKPTTGTARIMTENGHRYLELDSAFSASNLGPDLHVLLDTVAKPPKSYSSATAGRYVNLGKLEKTQGAQRYPIPDAINLGSFKSVNIWCRMANATFGYAPLHSSSTASR